MEVIELDGVQLKFTTLTLADEEEWKDWLRARLISDGKRDADLMELRGQDRADFLAAISAKYAAGKCGIITELGLEHAMTPDGIMKILGMASKPHHPAPGLDDATLRRILTECTDDLQRVLMHVLPSKKKVKGGSAGPTAGPTGTP